jgi:hypothetical protein
VGGQDATVAVQERYTCARNLPVLGTTRHLAVSFCKMGHRPSHTAMPVRQKPAMQIQGQRAVPIEVSLSSHHT